jgi:site-specific DNA-methyltransferase (adenine-specific)
MGKEWDAANGIAGQPAVWAACLRVLKPGGHLVAFGAPRTYHRLACAIEDAGFEIRDSLHWLQSQGFPKSLDVSKAFDRAAGVLQPEGKSFRADGGVGTASYRATTDPRVYQRPEPVTEGAKRWLGWGTALKPAHEPIVLARKALAGTVSENVGEHGTGALNIDGARVGDEPRLNYPAWNRPGQPTYMMGVKGMPEHAPKKAAVGRWPPNVVFSHAEDCAEDACASGCAVAELEQQAPGVPRFFPVFRYQAKVSTRERGPGNDHPTVKPLGLMDWLVRLVTPPGGLVLDPFMGSGTTLVAARALGRRAIGIEMDPDYCRLARKRISAAAGPKAGP